MAKKEDYEKLNKILEVLARHQHQELYFVEVSSLVNMPPEETKRLIDVLSEDGYAKIREAISKDGRGVHVKINERGKGFQLYEGGYQLKRPAKILWKQKWEKLNNLPPNRFWQVVAIILALVAISLTIFFNLKQ